MWKVVTHSGSSIAKIVFPYRLQRILILYMSNVKQNVSQDAQVSTSWALNDFTIKNATFKTDL